MGEGCVPDTKVREVEYSNMVNSSGFADFLSLKASYKNVHKFAHLLTPTFNTNEERSCFSWHSYHSYGVKV